MSSYNIPKQINGVVSTTFNTDDYATVPDINTANFVGIVGTQTVAGLKTMQNLTTFQSGMTNNGNTIIGDATTDTCVVNASSTFIGSVDMRNALTSYIPAKYVSGLSSYPTSYSIGGANFIGSNNTYLGYNTAGTTITANNCTFLGPNTGVNVSGYSNSTCIGNLAQITSSNQIVLGAPSTFCTIPNLVGSGNRAIFADLNGILTISSSDARLKDEITYLDSSESLDKVIQLKPSSWMWKKNGLKDYGLIAQDLMQVLPDLVFETPSHDEVDPINYLGINYHLLTPYLISSIQQLNKKNNGSKYDYDFTSYCNLWIIGSCDRIRGEIRI
jgi:hypothetical protein